MQRDVELGYSFRRELRFRSFTRCCLGTNMCSVSELTKQWQGVAVCSLKMMYIDGNSEESLRISIIMNQRFKAS